jgi:glycosyltransferase involved in cell wall biosynthesis
VKKIKIGIDVRMFSDAFTGIGRYNFEITQRFFVIRPDIEWVLFLNEPEYSKFQFPENVKKVCVNAPHYSLAEQTKFLSLLNKEKCDLVWFTHFNRPLLYFKPCVVTIHDTTLSFFPGKKMGQWWRKLAYKLVITNAVRAAKRIMTVSENTRKDVMKLFKISPKKITAIWNGISSDFHECTEKEHDEVRNKFKLSQEFLLYTGVWREHKNLVRLLQSFHEVQKLHPDIQLVITGRRDPHYPEVLQTVKDLKLEESVRFVGLVDFSDLRKLYSAATAYVFPSLYEGFGIPPLESMAAGTPAIVSNSSAIPEVCGDAAEYFDPENIKEMTEKINLILKDDNRRKELIAKGFERIKEFSWDNSAEETLNILLETVNLKKK